LNFLFEFSSTHNYVHTNLPNTSCQQKQKLVASPSDHLVPIDEQRFIASKIAGIDYIELPNRGHFILDRVFPELVANVIEKMSS
jgi:predicted alpha/beta hydrolase family esterase